jgi:hypothetical protein
MAKLTEQELSQLNGLRSETAELVNTLGELEFQKLVNESEIDKLKERVLANAKGQKELMDKFTIKYGSGRLDVETGEIVVIQ